MALNQNDTLLTHMCEGKTVTRLEALFNWGIQNITARINDLRSWGVEVRVNNKTAPNGHEYAEYFLTRDDVNDLLERGFIVSRPGAFHIAENGKPVSRKAA